MNEFGVPWVIDSSRVWFSGESRSYFAYTYSVLASLEPRKNAVCFMLVADVLWKPNAHSFALADDHYHTYAMYNFGQQMHRLLLLTENPWERSSKYVKPSEVHTKGNGSCNLCGKVSIASNSWHSSSCASYNTSISAFFGLVQAQWGWHVSHLPFFTSFKPNFVGHQIPFTYSIKSQIVLSITPWKPV